MRKEVLMDSFIFALNAVSPIILTVLIGYFLKRIGIFPAELSVKTNRLVFRVLLPVMLFVNVYNIKSVSDIGIGYIIYAALAIILVVVAAMLLVPLFVKKEERRAPLMQAIFRSNFALIGIPLAESLFGSDGAAVAALLSAVAIPIFNVAAVLCFSVFSSSEKHPSIKEIILDIVKNPLIIAIATGGVFLALKNVLLGAGVTTTLNDIPPIYKTLTYLSSTATPLALLSLGAQFEFSAVPELKKEIIAGTALRCAIVPAAALSVAYAIGVFNGAHFATFIAVFATPVAVSSVPMAQEMNGDTKLAGQLVVWTTLISAITIFLFTLIFKEIGVFV